MKLLREWNCPRHTKISLRLSSMFCNSLAFQYRGRSNVTIGVWPYLSASHWTNFRVERTVDWSLGGMLRIGRNTTSDFPGWSSWVYIRIDYSNGSWYHIVQCVDKSKWFSYILRMKSIPTQFLTSTIVDPLKWSWTTVLS